MKHWMIAAAAFVPAIALATPITFTTSNGKTVTVKVKNKATAAAPTTIASTGGGSIGSALASDVTLGGVSASELIYGAGVNPQQGANGNSNGFANAYAGSGSGDWASFAKFSGATSLGPVNSLLSGLTLTMGFGLTDLRHGTWSVTNNSASNNLALDLVFAMHTGGGSGAWLFDNYLLNAGSTALGTWSLNLLNNGGQRADYSNLTLFARNAVATPVPVITPTAPAAGGAAPVQGDAVAAVPPAGAPAASAGDVTAPAAGNPSVPATGSPDTIASSGSAPSVSAPVDYTGPANGGVAIQIPIGELLDELAKHGEIEPGSQIEFEGLFGDGQTAEVPEPATLAVFLAGLAMFGASLRLGKRRATQTLA